MKKIIPFIVVFTILQLAAPETRSQNIKKYIPEQGFWVLTSNIVEKNITNIKFYTNENELIYEEQVNGIRLNEKRKKTVSRLKKSFDTAFLAWNNKKTIPPKDLIAKSYKERR